jgi:hypothetical protein
MSREQYVTSVMSKYLEEQLRYREGKFVVNTGEIPLSDTPKSVKADIVVKNMAGDIVLAVECKGNREWRKGIGQSLP